MVHLEDKAGSYLKIYKSGSDERVIVLASQSYDEAFPPTCLFLSIKDIEKLSRQLVKFLEE